MTKTRAKSTGPYGRAVSEEIRSLMARSSLSGRMLAEKAGLHHNYLAKRLRDDMPLDVEDLEKIGKALGISPHEILRRAEIQMEISEMGQSGYGLAAKSADEKIGPDQAPQW